MVTFGLDISHHQDKSLDLAACRRDGIEFVFLKATEGATFVDPDFAGNLAEARAAGLLPAAYHYVRSNATAADQCANIDQAVPRDVPVILDVEANSGRLELTKAILERLERAGRRSPLLYLPRWYWTQIGSPSLAGMPPLWSSRYPDNRVGLLEEEWADVPAIYWAGYGGLDVAVLQFTSSARVADHQPLDANAYRGTREQMAALLGYTTTTEEESMFQSIELPPTRDDATGEPTVNEMTIALPWQGGSGGVKRVFAMIVAGAAGMDIDVAHWQRQIPEVFGVEAVPMVPDGTTVEPRGRTAGIQAPPEAHALIVAYSAPYGGSLVIEAATS